MMDAIRRLPPVPAVTNVEPAPRLAEQAGSKSAAPSFAAELESRIAAPGSLNFSAHARARLVTRSIQLTDRQVARLEHGVEQAAGKGARESLVMLDNLAFIVSVRNRTVVTAVDGASRDGNVFTQIDSAVIV